ncbi:hypothetical protein B0H13DRAFT_2036677, partial [Mycena leptocephala]
PFRADANPYLVAGMTWNQGCNSRPRISARVSCPSFLVFVLFLPFPFPLLLFHSPSLLSYFFYLVYMILTSSPAVLRVHILP